MIENSVKVDSGPVTLADLEALCAKLNRNRFVIDSGLLYFIGETERDGKLVPCLDRRTGIVPQPALKLISHPTGAQQHG